MGPGVERLAEEAANRFPEAKIAILSSDLSRGTLLRDAIRDVAEARYNLVIGTQLVAKGHHFPHLTLVAWSTPIWRSNPPTRAAANGPGR